MSEIERLRYLADNAVGGDLLPPAWAELARTLPALLDVAEAARAVCASPCHTPELEPTTVFDTLRAALDRLGWECYGLDDRNTPEAALAAALCQWRGDAHPDGDDYAEAAAILATLPPDWCGHDAAAIRLLMDSETRDRTALLDAEIARLRMALTNLVAAWEYASGWRKGGAPSREMQVAYAALAPEAGAS